MKVPLKWLADYVDLTLTPGELAQKLTVAGLEVAGFRSFGLPAPEGLRVRQDEPGPVWDRDKVFTAELVSVTKHPDADKLKLPLVKYAGGQTQQLVTGAPNIAVGDGGQKVVIGLAGTTFWDTHISPKKMSTLTPKPVRGVPSEGMVMSNAELGISDEHEGIIVLEADAPVGVPLADFMGDIVLEIDVLPNMARCLSLVGVAREVAALTGQKLKTPAAPAPGTGPDVAGRVAVRIDDAALCPRYAAALIEGVTVGPAPGPMQRRLTYAGMRPINAVVDVTNYVMLELGQPLHAFDYDVLKARAGGKGPTVIVRPAKDGETLVTLDGKERKLTPEMLLITDEKGPIALAGVMGGLETEVTAKTANVLLESASFDPISIRRTARALDLPSEASSRFAKGVHPDMVPAALARAAHLIAGAAGGVVAKGAVDRYPSPLPPRVVELKLSEVRRVLGVDVPLAECVQLLEALEFTVVPGKDALEATVPGHRLDIQDGPADLIEDIARLRGYADLPMTLLSEPLPAQRGDEALVFEERVKDVLVGLGFEEAISYALTTPEREAPVGTGEYVKLANPISSERTAMRRELLPGLLEAAERNLKTFDAVRLFEVGSVYHPVAGQALPAEPRRLAVALSGRRLPEHWGDGGSGPRGGADFYDLKGVVEALLADVHAAGFALRPARDVAAYHPGKSAALVPASDEAAVVGHFGELHPRVAAAFGLGGRTVLAAEFDLERLRALVPPRYAYRPVPRFPAALRDVAVVVPEGTAAEEVVGVIRQGGGELVREVRLFDVYRGESILAGTKSLAFALAYQADDRTLSDKEIEKAHKAVMGRLTHVLKATIRDGKG
ncbi:MAG: phenylalanine--tRNA ligase subunit beta [Gemmataceae bacterium]